MTKTLSRREFIVVAASGAATLALSGCGGETDPERYTEADIARLARQWESERKSSGRLLDRKDSLRFVDFRKHTVTGFFLWRRRSPGDEFLALRK